MKSRIIDCSMELFARHGIKGLTMSAVSTELSISKRTIYAYFSCKETLLEECLLSRLDEQRLFIAADEGLIDALTALYADIQRIDLQNARRFCCELLKFYEPVSKTFLGRLLDYASACGDKVSPGIEDGYIRRDVHPSVVCAAVAGYLSRLFVNTGCEYPDVRRTLSPESILIFTRGLCTIKGRAYLDQKLKQIA